MEGLESYPVNITAVLLSLSHTLESIREDGEVIVLGVK